MKTFLKTTCIAAVALAMTTFGVGQARANGWVVAGPALGGLAVGAAVGATIATAAAQPAYAYPPGYYAPAPGPVYAPAPVTVAVGAPYYYGPRVFAAPYYHPYVRYGYGWGHGHYWGRPYFRR